VRQAIADGRRKGHLTHDQADRLERELLGDDPSTVPKRVAPAGRTSRTARRRKTA
jgi:hypothetical protein